MCVGCVWCSRVLNSCYFNYVMNAISNSRQSYVNVGVVLLNKGCSQSMAGVWEWETDRKECWSSWSGEILPTQHGKPHWEADIGKPHWEADIGKPGIPSRRLKLFVNLNRQPAVLFSYGPGQILGFYRRCRESHWRAPCSYFAPLKLLHINKNTK